MNDPLIVGCRHPACNLYGVVHRLADRDRSLLEPLGQQLKRDFTAQAVVAGSIHFAHGPGTERRQDFAVSELRSCGDGHKSENYRRIQFWKFSRTGARLCALWMLRLCGTTQLTQSAGGNQSASPI